MAEFSYIFDGFDEVGPLPSLYFFGTLFLTDSLPMACFWVDCACYFR